MTNHLKNHVVRTTLVVMLGLLAGPTGALGQEAKPGRHQSAGLRPHVDETLVWNQVMLDAIVASTLGNPQTIRMAATVNTAMFDAQNAIGLPTYRPIFVTDRAPRGTHRRAAIVQAAFVTLKSFYPGQLTRFDDQRALSLAEFGGDDWTAVQRGLEWGEHVANQVLAWRETDGFCRSGARVYWYRCDARPVGVRNRHQHGGGQPRLHSAVRADQQHAIPVGLSTALDDPAQSGLCQGLQRGGDDRREDRLFPDAGSNSHRVLLQRLRHKRLRRSGYPDRAQAQEPRAATIRASLPYSPLPCTTPR